MSRSFDNKLDQIREFYQVFNIFAVHEYESSKMIQIQIQIQIQNCLFDIVCQVIVQNTLCIINVRRLPLRQ